MWRIDYISLRTYQRASVALAVLFILTFPAVLCVMWIAERMRSQKAGLAFLLLYLLVELTLMMFHRNAVCPHCARRLSFSVPFTGRCGTCKTQLDTVRV